jgi:hypothetical protein
MREIMVYFTKGYLLVDGSHFARLDNPLITKYYILKWLLGHDFQVKQTARNQYDVTIREEWKWVNG